MGISTVIAVISSVLAIAAAVVAALGARASWPSGMRSIARDLDERMESTEAKQLSLERKWVATVADLESIQEEIEGVLASVERKRKRVQGSVPRQQEAAQGTPERLAQLNQMARNSGLM